MNVTTNLTDAINYSIGYSANWRFNQKRSTINTVHYNMYIYTMCDVVKLLAILQVQDPLACKVMMHN